MAQYKVPKIGNISNYSTTLALHSFNRNYTTGKNERIFLVTRSNVALWTASFVALNKAWYSDFPRSSFHFFNDNSEWNQMDKAGHFWTNYHISRLSTEMWKWTGIADQQSVILGGFSGVAYGSIIEIQDGFSSEWGFSMGDMTANVAGAATFVAQELAWHEQRIQIKFGYSPPKYSRDIAARREQLYGNILQEQILKDYNAQTYWASGNIRSFFPSSALPNWLNLSVGYGSQGMFGGTENKWKDVAGNKYNRSDIPRIRNFYLGPDIDLTKIKTKSKWLKTFFYVANSVKFPAPALELNSQGKLRMHLLK